MSSAKDFVLEITPSIEDIPIESLSLLKFTVKKRQVDVITRTKHIALSVISIAVAIYLWHVIDYSEFHRFDLRSLSKITWDQWGVLGVAVALAMVLILHQEAEDSVIVMKDLGVQSVSKKRWKFQNDVETFIPSKDIIDLVIHEGFLGYGQVIFYLCILTRSDAVNKKGNENVIKIMFPDFLPRKDILLQVWKLSRELLFGDSKRYWRRVPGQGLKQIY